MTHDTTSVPRRMLGATGIEIGALGLGSWNSFGKTVNDGSAVACIVHRAFDLGIDFFDMADSYAGGRAEELMGAAFRALPRDRITISTKTCFPIGDDPTDRGLSRKRILAKIDDSLRRLGTDHVDLYFCHRFDPETPLLETMEAMNELIRQGKIRHWGTSEWPAHRIDEAFRLARRHGLTPPAVEQPELSLLQQLKYRHDTLPALRRHRLGAVTFSPLAHGLLTGKYDDGVPSGSRLDQVASIRRRLHNETVRRKALAMKTIAERLGCSRAQLAIAWAMEQPGVTSVILGATRVEQLEENLGAAAVRLDDEARRALDALFAPSPARILRYRAGRLLRRIRKR